MPTLINNPLSRIEIDPAGSASKSVIWLHGLGADGSDFVPLIPELHLPETLGIRFIFPHAPVIPVTINHHAKMRAWFDILGLTSTAKVDAEGITRACALVEDLIAQEMARGIAAEQIVLAGFSQGAVIALTTGLRYPQRLGGILALSGFLPLAEKVLATASQANRHLPIFLAHGSEDAIVPYCLGEATYAALKKAGYPIAWHSYHMDHAVCAPEITDISQWLQTCFSQ